MKMKITKAEMNMLDYAQGIWKKMGWHTVTGRSCRLSVMRRLIAKGLMRELPHTVAMCDDDGFTKEPERYRIGYELTDKGRVEWAKWKAMQDEINKALRDLAAS